MGELLKKNLWFICDRILSRSYSTILKESCWCFPDRTAGEFSKIFIKIFVKEFLKKKTLTNFENFSTNFRKNSQRIFGKSSHRILGGTFVPSKYHLPHVHQLSLKILSFPPLWIKFIFQHVRCNHHSFSQASKFQI